jgi:hypothetical protein
MKPVITVIAAITITTAILYGLAVEGAHRPASFNGVHWTGNGGGGGTAATSQRGRSFFV